MCFVFLSCFLRLIKEAEKKWPTYVNVISRSKQIISGDRVLSSLPGLVVYKHPSGIQQVAI